MTKNLKSIVASLVLGLSGLTQTSVALADADCPQPLQVTQKTWTRLKRAIPVADQLIEGTYYGRGHTTRTEYELHLIQYLGSRDTFVAVMENSEKKAGAIGVLRRKQGAYLWHGIHATRGALSQLEPVFEGRPLFSFSVNLDRKGRTADIEAVSLNPEAGVEMIRFTEARAPMLRRSPALLKYKIRTGWRAHKYVTLGRNEMDTTAEMPEDLCVDPNVPAVFRDVASWKVQTMSIGGESNWSKEFLGRMELPGVIALRPTVYDEVEPRPQDVVTGALVSLHRTHVLRRDRDETLLFEIGADGFLSGSPTHFKNEF